MKCFERVWPLALAVLFFAVSCEKSDEFGLSKQAGSIGYEVGMSSGFVKGYTKSSPDVSAAESGKRVTIEKLNWQVGGKKLYLHTEVQKNEVKALQNAANISATKGTVLSNAAGPDKMGVSAWIYGGSYEDGKTYFLNDVYDCAGGEVSSNRYWPKKSEGWNFRFYAYAPTDAQTTDNATYVTLPDVAEWENGVPSFDYTVPSDVEKQSDLLVASCDIKNNAAGYGATVPVDFGHALTAVQFKVDGLDNFRIKTVEISGVKNAGTYTYSYSVNGDGNAATSTHDAGAWSVLEEGTGEYTLNFTQGALDASDGTADGSFDCTGKYDHILNPDNTADTDLNNFVLFLMPQELTSDATVTLTGIDEYRGEITLSASIGGDGKKWEKGTKVIYKISVSDVGVEYVFEVEDITAPRSIPGATPVTNTAVVPYYGQIGREYKVISYKKVYKLGQQDPEIVALPWYVAGSNSYQEESDDNPDRNKKTSHWIDWISTMEGPGGITGSEVGEENKGNYNVISIEPEITDGFEGFSHARMLDNPQKGTAESAYNLAGTNGADINETTANCYIVDAPGYYKLPLVYGNAYVNGAVNESSYKSSVGSKVFSGYLSEGETDELALTANVMSPLINYAGAGITSPWILTDTGIQDVCAEVVWQDEPCIITEAKIEGNYLHFRVREDCISEGNAVVAVKQKKDEGAYGEGTILWSWHIWITDNSALESDVEITNRFATNAEHTEYAQNKFGIMGVPLGYCRLDGKYYKERTGQIVFCQKEEDVVRETISLPVNQGAFMVNLENNRDTVVAPPANACYYQYGRKDPFFPAYATISTGEGIPTEDKPYYSDLRDQFKHGYGGGRVGFHMTSDEAQETISLENGIIWPGQMCGRKIFNTPQSFANGGIPYEFHHWISNEGKDWNVFNLWNMNSNVVPMFVYENDSYVIYSNLQELMNIGVTKTIYDPSPAGYEMPRVDAFAGFTYEGVNYGDDRSAINMDDVSWNNPSLGDGYIPGYKFNATPMQEYGVWPASSETLFIGAFGFRNDLAGSILMNDGTSYGDYGAALTSSPVCIQWEANYVPTDEAVTTYTGKYYAMQLARFNYSINSKSFRPFSASNMSIAFPVYPARTGMNGVAAN